MEYSVHEPIDIVLAGTALKHPLCRQYDTYSHDIARIVYNPFRCHYCKPDYVVLSTKHTY